MKDLLATKGIPTTWGSEPFRDQVFDYDATVIRKLRDRRRGPGSQAGHGTLGRWWRLPLLESPSVRNLQESVESRALGGRIIERARRQPCQPAMVPFAIGSETGGSIVVAAAYTGITAVRPTYGLVSRFGAMALSWTLDKLGPMCHSSEDCALVLSVIAGDDPNDPSSSGRTSSTGRTAAARDGRFASATSATDFSERAVASARPAFQGSNRSVPENGSQTG